VADNNLSSSRAELSAATVELDKYPYSKTVKQWESYSLQQIRVDSLRSTVNSGQSTCNNLQNSIDRVGEPPAPVIQPLPKEKSSALVWLFYMHMPPLLRCFSRACFLSQQMLLPSPPHNTGMDISMPAALTSNLLKHYDKYQQASEYCSTPHTVRGSGGHVLLCSKSSIPEKVGPNHVDHFRSR